MLMARYTEQDIERAIRTVASLIDRFGEAYWPILERLEQELESRRSRAARLQRYLRADAPINREAVAEEPGEQATLAYPRRHRHERQRVGRVSGTDAGNASLDRSEA